MSAKAEDKEIVRIKKHKKEYDSKIGPSGEFRLSENFKDVNILDKSNPDFPAEKNNFILE